MAEDRPDHTYYCNAPEICSEGCNCPCHDVRKPFEEDIQPVPQENA